MPENYRKTRIISNCKSKCTVIAKQENYSVSILLHFVFQGYASNQHPVQQQYIHQRHIP